MFFIPLAIIFGVLILLAAAILLFIPEEWRKIYVKYAYDFLVTGILGLIGLVARQEQLPWLASRAFITLVVLMLIGWSLGISIWILKTMPKYVNEKKVEERYKKYLPGTKSQKSVKSKV